MVRAASLLRLHVGGKIEMRNKSQLRTRDDLSMAYTPGVAPEAQRTGESRVGGGEIGYAPGDTAEFRPVNVWMTDSTTPTAA